MFEVTLRSPIAVFVFRSAEVYGLTASADGANLPEMPAPWQRQAETLLVVGTTPFGIDAAQAVNDIESHGYHLTTVGEMLRRSMAPGYLR